MTERWNGQNYYDDDCCCCCCGGGGGGGGSNKSGGVVGWCDDSNNHQNTSYNFLATIAVLPYFHIIRHSCLSNLSCTHNSRRSRVATLWLWINFLICIYMGKKTHIFIITFISALFLLAVLQLLCKLKERQPMKKWEQTESVQKLKSQTQHWLQRWVQECYEQIHLPSHSFHFA